MNNEIFKQFEEQLRKTRVEAPRGITGRILARIEEKEVSPVSRKKPLYARFVLKPSLAVLYTLFIFTAGWFLHERFRQVPVNVTFVLYHPDAERVSIAGDFNRWDTGDIMLDEENGYWSATVAMKPGVYQYMFVIDGDQWMPDPTNTASVESPFGGVNSVVEVQSS